MMRSNVLIIGPVKKTEAEVSAILAELTSPPHFWAADAPLPSRADGRAIVIRDIAKWSRTLQTAWFDWLTVQQEPRPQMIATSSIAIFPLVRQGMFLADLYYRLNTILVDLWISPRDDSPVTVLGHGMGGHETPPIDVARVECLTLDLIAERKLSLELIAVRHEADQWRVVVRERSQRFLTIEMPDVSTVAQVQARLKHALLLER